MIDRREFIIRGAALGAVGLSAGTSGCRPSRLTDGGTTAGEAQDIPPFELSEITIEELQARMASGERTARSMAELYLTRIEALDGKGPELRSIIEVNPDALEIADRLDAERRSRGPRGPLHGIPIVLKDNIGTHDRMTTTAGSLALEGSIPPRDSFVAERLRAAGAVLLAKANLSEWANFRGAHSSSGWSARGGQCRNPYALDRSPLGSSSGPAVVVAANLATVAVGTETNGSILAPSSACGIVGIKPTVGLWSRSGIIPISHSQDTAGPMARSVRDAAILLGAVTGIDGADPATSQNREPHYSDFTQFLVPGGLRGARIGVARNFPGFFQRVLALLEDAVEAMRNSGAVVTDPVDIPQLTDADWGAQDVVLEYEFKNGFTKYLAASGSRTPIKSLSDLIAFNTAHADTELAFFGQEKFVSAVKRGPLTDSVYLDALRAIQKLAGENGIDAVMKRHALDAIVAPTLGPAFPIDHVLGDRFDSGYSSAQSAIAGYPNITVPMGYVSGLPVGLSFFGRRWSEPVLLRAAYAYEQSTKHRRAPAFRSTAA